MGAIVNGLTLIGLPRLRRRLPDLQRLHEGRRSGSPRSCGSRRRSSSRTTRSASGRTARRTSRSSSSSTLRATPNLDVVRPAGFNETGARLAPRAAPDRPPDRAGALAPGPARCGIRPACPTTRSSAAPTCCATADGGEPQLILMATGSEVHIANDAAKLLEADGIRVRLVSMPCLDRFAEQDQAYRDGVLPPAVRARVAVEAASPIGWHRWVGDLGDVVAMEGFGASAPAKVLYRALRVHRRGRRRARPGGPRAGTEQRDERHRGQRAARGADRRGHQRVAGPDPPRHDRERRAGPHGRGGLAARRHLQPGDLREGDPRLARLRRGHRRGGARGPVRARGLPPPGGARRAARGRRAAPRLRRHGRLRRLRLARGRAAARARHRRARSSRRACTGAWSTAPT